MVEIQRVGKTKGVETVVVNVGPQHPSTHGVLHIVAEVQGEQVLSATPILGYLHRGIEKIAEERNYAQVLVLCDRMDYLSAFSTELAYCRAVEQLAGIEVPERAQYLRTIFVELMRIASHLVWWGTYTADIGAMTPLLWAFIERERILDFFEEASGARMMPNYIRFGGVKEDLPEGDILERIQKYLTVNLPQALADYEGLVTNNEIFIGRTKGINPMTTEQAIEWGLTGPLLRSTGVPRDLRKDAPYEAYDKVDFDIPVAQTGDCFDRYIVRMEEMRESAKIVLQLIDKLPEGEIRSKMPKMFKPAAGEVYVRTETPRGELGVYVASNGTDKPHRVHFRGPSFINLAALSWMAVGWKIADLIAILGSIDIVLGEVDR